ncbi:MAG: hypothetical protein HUK06_08410 [Bacteroidaceae bacterium]|nr:hypothetical protein [Bacteroidaceae bacterium]
MRKEYVTPYVIIYNVRLECHLMDFSLPGTMGNVHDCEVGNNDGSGFGGGTYPGPGSGANGVRSRAAAKPEEPEYEQTIWGDSIW